MDRASRFIYLFYHVVAAPFRLLPIDHKSVLLEAYYGKGFQDSPSVIAEELHRRDKDIRLLWLIRNEEEAKSLPEYVEPVKRFSFKELYHLSTSKVWIDNCRKNKGVVKRKGQFYIQTWHGGIHGKRVEKDVTKTLSESYVENAIHDSEMADLFLSGSTWETELYHNAFWYDGEVLEEGLPRNDIFFVDNQKIVAAVRTHFNLPDKVKVALYAPTFRQDGSSDCYNLDFERLLANLDKYWGGEWILLVRMHPSATTLQEKFTYSDRIKNASLYPEINELIIASNLFVTDYSSCMFDAMLTDARIIQYASDIDSYAEERGTYFDFADLPVPLATNNDEMDRIIAEYDDQVEKKKCHRFLSDCGSAEKGVAAKAAVDRIMVALRK